MPILSERFSMSASSQYYSSLSSIESSVEHFSNLICLGYREKCEIILTGMRSAAYLDVDYDTITRALVVNVGWSSAPRESSWDEDIYRGEKDGTIEIGVLNYEPNPDPEDIQFGGFLTVLGQDESPSTSAPSVALLTSCKLTTPQNQRASKHLPGTTPSSPPRPQLPKPPNSTP
jgi:hypothetical protein